MSLLPPEGFERREISGHLTDRISVGKHGRHVAVVLHSPELETTLIFQTTPAGARQVAASLLNQADELDDTLPRRTE
jgi:hypothetical protein